MSSKLKRKTPEQCQLTVFMMIDILVFLVNFGQFAPFSGVIIVNSEEANTNWE